MIEVEPAFLLHEILNCQSCLSNEYVGPTLKISVNGAGTTARGKPITDSNRVDDILRKFKSKYGGDVKKYYPKVDVAVEVPL
jgi:hypothetical protein